MDEKLMVCREDTQNYPGVEVGRTTNTLPVSVAFYCLVGVMYYKEGPSENCITPKRETKDLFCKWPLLVPQITVRWSFLQPRQVFIKIHREYHLLDLQGEGEKWTRPI